MKVKLLKFLVLIASVLFIQYGHSEIRKIIRPDAPVRQFIFVENNLDDNYFVTPEGALDPRMTGAKHWTGIKYNGSGAIKQQSLGYIDNGYNTPLRSGWKFDMWLDDSPISHPLLGLRCINWYSGCDMATSLIKPQITDSNGFYGVTSTPGGVKWMHGMMSDSFYQYLRQLSVGSTFSMVINSCQTEENYDATSGGRCKDQSSGNWYVRKVSHMKAAHLRLIETNALSQVFINSDGIPTLGDGNTDCRITTIKKDTGLSCKMVNYTLESNGLSNTSVHIFPAIINSALDISIKRNDMQFSLDGNSWKPVNRTLQYYNLNDLKSSRSIYVFFSSNFFKQLIKLGLSDVNTKDIFNFRLYNIISPESGWYEFSPSNTLIIKPRNFSISIISDDYSFNPKKEGYVGGGKPSLDFGYTVTTSGKTAADEVLIKVKGPSQVIDGESYCIFSSADGDKKVPFPATLEFITKTGAIKKYDAGCDDKWRDMSDALWLETPWTASSGEVGYLDKTTVKYSIQMDRPISLRTVDKKSWFGDVSASGEIHVQATWRHIN